jgi:hypothetical protein
MRVGQDRIDDVAYAAEPGRPDLDAGERRVVGVLLGSVGVQRGVAHGEIVQRSMLVGRASVVSELQNPPENLLGDSRELLLVGVVGPRDRFQQRIDVKGVDLVIDHRGHHHAVAQVRRCDGAPQSNHDVDVCRPWRRA